MTSKEHETTLNVQLASELRRRGLAARPQVHRTQDGHNRWIDIEVHIGPVVIAVEAEHGQSAVKRNEAIGDADARLKQGLAHCSVAVCYPDYTTEDTVANAEFQWNVRDGSTGPSNWTTGDLEQLTSVIRLTPAQLGNPDFAAAALSNSLDEAVRRLSDTQKRLLAQTLDLPPGKSAAGLWNQAAKRAVLVVATAVMFHARLDSHLQEMMPADDNRTNPPEPFTGVWPPAMAQICAESSDPVGSFVEAWNLILALDYKPIFETGRAALLSCPADLAFADAIRETARAALVVVRNIAGLRHDLLGRIFHTVLDTARYDGSFYTTTAAATLLATLAITEEICDWSDTEAIGKFRITDPACGTGTLLMAAAERIRDLAPLSQDDEQVARALIEQVLSGYDINLTATHMAATTLGLLSPTTRFRSMKMGRTLLGVDAAGDAYLGSLEFLDRQPKLMPWPNSAQVVSQVDSGEQMATADPADLVIMNPPFTRDSLRHDQFSRDDERKIKDREKRLFANKPVHLSSNGNAFIVLAEFINKTEGSTIATVAPLVTATNASSRQIRQHLANSYYIETIVTSHDPERIYFSENTNIGELLLVCRRWPSKNGPKPATRVVNLARNPATPVEALNVASAIQHDTVESQGYGTTQKWPEAKIAAGDWGAVQFLSPHLCQLFADLKSGLLFSTTLLGDIAAIGPAGQRIRDAFTRSGMPDGKGRVALWLHDTEATQSMLAKVDTHLVAKEDKAHLADSYWQQRGTFFLPQRLFLQTTRATTVRLDTRALGSAWVPCRTGSIELEKAACMFLNSSVGILSMLGDRSNKKPTYPNLSLDDMRKIVVPNLDAVHGGAIVQLATAYDANSQKTMLPLPQMDTCVTRKALDKAVIEALGLDEEMVSTIRRDLAMEPSVTGRRYAGYQSA